MSSIKSSNNKSFKGVKALIVFILLFPLVHALIYAYLETYWQITMSRLASDYFVWTELLIVSCYLAHKNNIDWTLSNLDKSLRIAAFSIALSPYLLGIAYLFLDTFTNLGEYVDIEKLCLVTWAIVMFLFILFFKGEKNE